MANSSINIPDLGERNIAGYSFTEDGVTKHIERTAINDSTGADALGLVGATATSSDASGTILSFLRGIVKILAAVWDGVTSLKVVLASSIMGEDFDQNVLKVEQRFEYKTELSADGSFISGPGFVHALIYSCTTGGTVVLRDSTSAGSGTIMKTLVLPVGVGSILLDMGFGTGLYADYDAGTLVATLNVSARANA